MKSLQDTIRDQSYEIKEIKSKNEVLENMLTDSKDIYRKSFESFKNHYDNEVS